MNWSGAKNWLIVLFVSINIFLIFTIVKSDMRLSVIEAQTINQTVEILRQNDIFVSADIIPTKMPKLGAIDVENSIADFDNSAKKILGEQVASLSEGHYASSTMRLSLKGDTVLYSDSAPSDNIKELNSSSAQRYVTEWLQKHGFENNMPSSYAIENDNGFTVYINQKIDRYNLLDSYFEAQVTKNGITHLSGSWFVPSSEQSILSNDTARVKPITSVLLDFARDDTRIKNGSNTISQIDLGYITGEKNIHHTFATAMPMWRIRCSDGKEYFFEAR